MSAVTRAVTTIYCDGRKIGTECDEAKHTDVQTQIEFRAWLKRVHLWTRRPWQDRWLDLCAECGEINTPLPDSATRGGRPPKVSRNPV